MMLKRIIYMLATILVLVLSAACILYETNPLFFSSPKNTWIFLLAGQSNMAGRGYISLHDRDRAWKNIYTITSDLSIKPAHQPLHWDASFAGYSMGLDFAVAIQKKNDNCKILLVPAALGNSSIFDWQESGFAFERAMKLMAVAKDYGHVQGILWHQGETDSKIRPKVKMEIYKRDLIKTIELLRRISGDRTVPFIAGSLPDFLTLKGRHPNYPKVNQAIQQVMNITENASYVELGDLSDIGDGVHFSTSSLKKMGIRYANAFSLMRANK